MQVSSVTCDGGVRFRPGGPDSPEDDGDVRLAYFPAISHTCFASAGFIGHARGNVIARALLAECRQAERLGQIVQFAVKYGRNCVNLFARWCRCVDRVIYSFAGSEIGPASVAFPDVF